MYLRRSVFAIALSIALTALVGFAQTKTFTFDADAAGADSGGWRSAFRSDVDHDSEVMPISVPN